MSAFPLSDVPVPPSSFQVGDWRVIPEENRLVSPDSLVIEVEYKVMEVLVVLARQQGIVVSREELMATVWPETIVGPDLLSRCISILRKTFDDDPQHPRYIETIRKRGYRILASVEPFGNGVATAATTQLSQSHASPLLIIGSVLVLLAAGWGYMTIRGEQSAFVSPARVLTSLPGREINPALSPDGDEIAYAWRGEQWDIYVQKIGNGEPLRRTLHDADDVFPVWSPDGANIAFQRVTDSACTILVMPALAGPSRPVGRCLVSAESADHLSHKMSWSPNGRMLAFTDFAEDQPTLMAIYLLDIDTQTRLQLTHPELGADVAPSFSPDGISLAFTRLISWTQSAIYRIPVEGGTSVAQTDDRSLVLGHTWLPDGSGLVFASDRDGLVKLWQQSTGSPTPTRLAVSGRYQNAPTFASNSTRFAYENWHFDTNIWRWSLIDTLACLEHFQASTLWEGEPAFSPDGRQIAFVSSRTGSSEVWRSNSDGTDLVQLTRFGDASVGPPTWSPDGKAILFTAQEDSWEHIYRVATIGSAPTMLTSGETNHLFPSWSQQGHWIYFAADTNGDWGLWKRHLETGETRLLTSGFHIRAQEAQNGETLYFTRRQQPGLWQISTTGGSPSLLIPDWPAEAWADWQVAKDGLHLAERTTEGMIWLTHFDSSTQQRTRLKQLPPSLETRQQSFAVSPLGHEILVVLNDKTDSDLMLVDW